jgi:pyruvate-ferredoxin/flavodoxin oxidoreductase
VLSPDPAVFGHSNPLSGLKKGGVFIIQSNLGKETWANFPLWAQKFIVDNEIRVFYLDAFQIAREEAGSAELSCACRASPSRAPSSRPARPWPTPA